MRIIAGNLRGRVIEAPPGLTTRPMLDRVRQAVFDIIGAAYGEPGSIPPVAVLDCFAGSGALGIEALSRGAARCSFVEEDFKAGRTLQGNLKALGLLDRSEVLRESALKVRLKKTSYIGSSGTPKSPPLEDIRKSDDLAAPKDSMAEHSLPMTPEEADGYTIVFLDPPYPLSRDSSVEGVIGQLLVTLPQRVPLDSEAMIVLRHETGVRYDEQAYGTLKAFDVRKYGGMEVTFMGPVVG